MPIKADKSLRAYYNEIDPFAAQWMRNLMAEGWITKGDVDERSIEDVQPNDLTGYDRLHFFAGVAVWDYALNQAGWGRGEIWTGSCPCQPFSAAGKGAGFSDERHLWPAFNHLISQCKPAIVLGEQVASKDADTWIDLVHTDMEALGYAFGAIPFPSAGVGSPHIRDRLYWVADAAKERRQHEPAFAGSHGALAGATGSWVGTGGNSHSSWLADSERSCDRGQEQAANHGRKEANRSADRAGGCGGSSGGLGNAERSGGHDWRRVHRGCLEESGGAEEAVRCELRNETEGTSLADRPGPTNGFWRDADWLGCRDGKFRPVEPGTFPLVNGAAARVVRLRGYGNAINAVAAQTFIEAFMECCK